MLASITVESTRTARPTNRVSLRLAITSRVISLTGSAPQPDELATRRVVGDTLVGRDQTRARTREPRVVEPLGHGGRRQRPSAKYGRGAS
jgi:hypothetical protein